MLLGMPFPQDKAKPVVCMLDRFFQADESIPALSTRLAKRAAVYFLFFDLLPDVSLAEVFAGRQPRFVEDTQLFALIVRLVLRHEKR